MATRRRAHPSIFSSTSVDNVNNENNVNKKLQQVIAIAIDAGAEILDVYASEFAVEMKGDGSPLTEADRRAHDLIHRRLRDLAPDIPLLSEESDADAFAKRREWKRFWLVDPLDGTREFVERSDQFTVNIALIEGNHPVLGVVYAPVCGVSYYAAPTDANTGAFRVDADGKTTAIQVKKFNRKKAIMMASRSHSGAEVETYRERLATEAEQVEVTGMGSSLKICLVAEGRADIYPRLGPTSEWDTAAAQCVLEAAGGSLTTLSGEPLQYNKESIRNPWFLAGGDRTFDWAALARDIEPPPHRRKNR